MNHTFSVDELRRMATAITNVINEVPAGGGQWCRWVPDRLHHIADQIEADQADQGEQ